jgi:hypothetical protein
MSINDEKDMGRVSVSLPVETIRQFDEWAVLAGVKRSQFTSMALVIGARVLARQVTPEAFFTPDVWKSLADAMGVDAVKLQNALEAAKH